MLSDGATKLIGIIGKKGHGKSETSKRLATILHKEHQKDVEIITFSSFLKDALKEIFGLTYEQLHDPTLKETIVPYWNVTPRELLQKFGTEMLRDYFPKVIPQ